MLNYYYNVSKIGRGVHGSQVIVFSCSMSLHYTHTALCTNDAIFCQLSFTGASADMGHCGMRSQYVNATKCLVIEQE